MAPFLRFVALAGAAVPLVPARQPAPNTIEVTVSSGPFAGTYRAKPSEVICMHAKTQRVYAATWKDFSPQNPKALAEAGINVSNPDAPGAKVGDVRITFGPDKKATVYTVTQMALTFTRQGKGAEIGFQGKSKEGVQLRVAAKCSDVEEM